MYGRHRYAANLEALRRELGRPEPRSFLESPHWDSDTLDADVEWELERLRAAGVKRVVAIDLAKEAFGLPVVRVVIPGLEAISEMPRYLPGLRARAMAAARA